MIIAAVLAATSIPKDIEDKSIYSVITKPVCRISLILGRFWELYMCWYNYGILRRI